MDRHESARRLQQQIALALIVENSLALCTWTCGIEGCEGHIESQYVGLPGEGDYIGCNCDKCYRTYNPKISFELVRQLDLPKGEII
jgi:hypothetical protein